jgi:2-polyprenyl-6-methoxyphenol hydroxylase-like FAD-dependent oxidoreductase
MVNNFYPVIKMKNINILISGAGIAGLTLAFWLKSLPVRLFLIQILLFG